MNLSRAANILMLVGSAGMLGSIAYCGRNDYDTTFDGVTWTSWVVSLIGIFLGGICHWRKLGEEERALRAWAHGKDRAEP